ncbi:MAG TPA: protein-tyrosine phosphatase family protein [Thermoanaerobaculia bacterium]|jgi:protein-tyrosine phosphatase|nr:protein-tyrosine phosphatase family protein [Thermoanaerobaculia bacterium]
MFRTVELPDTITGKLFLHSMPGRSEAFEAAREAIVGSGIAQVVCLAPNAEVVEKSPDYARAIESGVPWRQVSHAIPDYGVPDDVDAFRKTVDDAAAALRRGENVLVHCAAGIGRTGTFAVAVLCRLGVALPEAGSRVKAAGSSAETKEQRAFLESICGR